MPKENTHRPSATLNPRPHPKTLHNRLTGCLLTGASVEFMSSEQILRRFGPRGIMRYAPA
jgi:hypothetical protein